MPKPDQAPRKGDERIKIDAPFKDALKALLATPPEQDDPDAQVDADPDDKPQRRKS